MLVPYRPHSVVFWVFLFSLVFFKVSGIMYQDLKPYTLLPSTLVRNIMLRGE